jgi:hypothetical protein
MIFLWVAVGVILLALFIGMLRRMYFNMLDLRAGEEYLKALDEYQPQTPSYTTDLTEMDRAVAHMRGQVEAENSHIAIHLRPNGVLSHGHLAAMVSNSPFYAMASNPPVAYSRFRTIRDQVAYGATTEQVQEANRNVKTTLHPDYNYSAAEGFYAYEDERESFDLDEF